MIFIVPFWKRIRHFDVQRRRKWKIVRLMGNIIINRLTHALYSRVRGGRIRRQAISHLVPHWASLSSDLMHLKRTHLVSAASFFPNSISRPYNYLSFSSLAYYSLSLSPGPLCRIPGLGIYTVMSSMTREMQISAEISRGIPVWKCFFVLVDSTMSRLDWTRSLIFILIFACVISFAQKDSWSSMMIDVRCN